MQKVLVALTVALPSTFDHLVGSRGHCSVETSQISIHLTIPTIPIIPIAIALYGHSFLVD